MNKQMTGGGHGEPSKIDRSIIIVAASPRQTKAVGSASLGWRCGGSRLAS
jgi:hypothetical protein